MHQRLAGLLLVLFYIASSASSQPASGDPSTGLLFVDPATYQSIPLASTPLMGELPESADLSGNFPMPGNQGKQASCVGWAVAYALKSYQESVERGWSPGTSDKIFSPAFIYNQIKTSEDCKGGTSFVDALNLLRRDGVAPLSEFPYSDGACSARPDQRMKQLAKPFSISDWRRVNVQDETEVKNHIAAGFPVLFGMIVDRPFFNLRGSEPYRQFSGENLGGHAMVVVGYDDNKQSFKLINSWGTGWGDGGFGWISYTAFRQAVREGYVAQDIVVVQPTPQPAPRPVPRPVPPPAPSAPVAALGIPNIQHNAPVAHPAGLTPGAGMIIRLPGTLSNAAGKSVQIVVRFFFYTGLPVYANPQEPSYRDVSGLVATGTTPLLVSSDHVDLGSFSMSIPYYALNLQATNGSFTYQLALTATVYVDNFALAQSNSVPFILRW